MFDLIWNILCKYGIHTRVVVLVSNVSVLRRSRGVLLNVSVSSQSQDSDVSVSASYISFT